MELINVLKERECINVTDNQVVGIAVGKEDGLYYVQTYDINEDTHLSEPIAEGLRLKSHALSIAKYYVEKYNMKFEDWDSVCIQLVDIQVILKKESSFRYQLLSRMKMDCDYYLGYGRRSERTLWAKNEEEHIKYMKQIWDSFPRDEKPEWLTWNDILKYEKKMCLPKHYYPILAGYKAMLYTAQAEGIEVNPKHWNTIEEFEYHIGENDFGVTDMMNNLDYYFNKLKKVVEYNK